MRFLVEYPIRHGRSRADVDLMVWSEPWDPASEQAYPDSVGRLGELGATWTPLRLDTSSFTRALDALRSWGEVRAALG